MQRKIILCVDDDHVYLDTLEEALEDEGYFVKTASNGKLALEQLESMPDEIGLVLLDIEMPEMNGMEFLQKVSRVSPNVPIMVASSKKGMMDDFDLQMHPQVKGFMVKPYDIGGLVELLATKMRKIEDESMRRVVLIGEGDEKARNEYRKILEDNGCIVKTARTRDRAVEVTENFGDDIDVIMLSFEFLGATHGAALSMLQDVVRGAPKARVLLVFSNEGLSTDLFLQKSSHVHKTLAKPVKPSNLVFTIRNI